MSSEERETTKRAGADDPPMGRSSPPVPMAPALKWVVAAVWALLVGSLMSGAAWLLDMSTPEIELIGVLGGLGAAAFILVFAARRH